MLAIATPAPEADTLWNSVSIEALHVTTVYTVSKYLVDHDINTMSQQQQLLKQELTVSQFLRIHGKEFRQVRKRYSDGHDGRCAVGVIMSYYGWKGKADSHAAEKLLGASIALRRTGVNKDLIIRLNDSGKTFEEIADYLGNIIPEN